MAVNAVSYRYEVLKGEVIKLNLSVPSKNTVNTENGVVFAVEVTFSITKDKECRFCQCKCPESEKVSKWLTNHFILTYLCFIIRIKYAILFLLL